MNTEDKLRWCDEYGPRVETAFVVKSLACGIPVSMNPEKRTNIYTHDLVAHVPADLKTIRTPFFTAHKYGFDPDYTVTLNVKDVRHYSVHPAFFLFFDVEWPEQQNFGIGVSAIVGLWLADFKQIQRMVADKRTPLHTYQRRTEDTSGNARDSYLLDLRWFTELPSTAQASALI